MDSNTPNIVVQTQLHSVNTCALCALSCSAAWPYNLQTNVLFVVVAFIFHRSNKEAVILTSSHIEQILWFVPYCQWLISLSLHHWPFTLDPLAMYFCSSVLMERNMGAFTYEFFLHMNSYFFMCHDAGSAEDQTRTSR